MRRRDPIRTFAGMNNITDPGSFADDSDECVEIVNCNVSPENALHRRAGFILREAVSVTSAWTAENGTVYCVSGTRLCRIVGSEPYTLTTAFTVLPACEFVQVNDIVVFSDGEKIGWIDELLVGRFDVPGDWVNVAALETWVADHYPADPATEESNFEIDAYSLATKAGRCLCFYNGALYLAVNNFVFCTKTFDAAHMDVRYNVVAGFPSNVTMIRAVHGGLFIGSGQGVTFLAGGGIVVDENQKVIESFTPRVVSKHAPIYGTALTTPAAAVPQLSTNGDIAVWATPQGICVGVSGGAVTNLSEGKVTLPSASSGIASYLPLGGLHQYIVCFNTSPSLFIAGDTALDTAALKDTWAVTLPTGTHGKFTNFVFESFFTVGAARYGANKLGLFEFTGKYDFDGVATLKQYVASHALTPAISFGSHAAKVLQSLYTRARCEGELQVMYYVNEHLAYASAPLVFNDLTGARTLRSPAPRGARGTHWQFKITNVNGAAFTLFSLEPKAVASTRTR